MKVAACLVVFLAGSASAFAPAASSSKVGISPLSSAALRKSSLLSSTKSNDYTDDDRRRFLQNSAAASLAALAGSVVAFPGIASASGGATAGKYTYVAMLLLWCMFSSIPLVLFVKVSENSVPRCYCCGACSLRYPWYFCESQ
jgi:hypothetical protein